MNEKSDIRIRIDGRMGEGGGQVLRASLALSIAFGRAFSLTNIRANRPKPGLKRQHLACVNAAREICRAEVVGADINSLALSFRPGALQAGDYSFDIGGGGSCTLVLQAALPPLMAASGPSRIKVRGGTHVPMAPIYEYFQRTLLPVLERMGPRFSARLVRSGFMQIGGGQIEVEVEPVSRLTPLDETGPVKVESISGLIRSHGLDESIGRRESEVLNKIRDLGSLVVENHPAEDAGPGNVVILELASGRGLTIASGVGQRGLAAEKVARQAINRALQFLGAHVPIDVHLADQLIVPLALAGGGRFLTEKPSLHTLTMLELLPLFTDLKATAAQVESKAWLIEISSR